MDDGGWVVLGLTAIAALLLGPIGFFIALSHGGRLRRLTLEVQDLRRQLDVVKGPVVAASSPRVVLEAPPPEPAPVEAAVAPIVDPVADEIVEPIPPDFGVSAPPPPAPKPPKPPRASLEERLGARWTVWVGGVAVALGALLLVRYSIEQGYFGPGARIVLGLALAAALVGGGERMRRGQGGPAAEAAWANIPAALTAAGTVAAFGSIYAAHALYGFIGPAIAFVLLGGVGLAAMSAAALHGPALAALGLIGSLVAPVLVASDRPSPWPVVVYLVVVVASTYALARLRRWLWLALGAAAGGAAWTALLWLGAGGSLDSFHAALAMLVTQSALAALFLGVAPHRGEADESARLDFFATGALAVFTALALPPPGLANFDPWWIAAMAAMVAILAASGATAAGIASLSVLAGVVALGALSVWPAAADAGALDPSQWLAHWRWPAPADPQTFVGFAFVAALGAGALAGGRLLRSAALPMVPAALYAGAGALTPLGAILIADLRLAEGDPSLRLAATAAVLAGGFVAAATVFQRRLAAAEAPAIRLGLGAMASASIAALASGLVFALDGGALTVSLALAALGAAYVAMRLEIPAMRWCVAGLGVAIGARLAYEPRVVGAALSPTPIFNWLLFGYGVPAVSFAAAARIMRRGGEDTPVRVADALAVLFAAFLVFFEIRHGANAGDPFAHASGLVEQGLLAVSSLGFAIVLTRLDAARANVVFRWASLGAGALGALVAAGGLLFAFNPFLQGERVEGGVVVNALAIAYLLPAVLAGALAYFARSTRPKWCWGGAAVLSAALGLTYIALQIRVFLNGPNVSFLQGFTLAELGLDASVCLLLALAIDRWGGASRLARRSAFGFFVAGVVIGLAGVCGIENPLLTNEDIAGGPILNTLLVAFLAPTVLSVAFARRRESAWMRATAILWLFAYVSLETRRLFHGSGIGLVEGFPSSEFYAYSAVWLALGLGLLFYGVWRGSREARYASAFFVLATTLKVFLLDFNGLEGALRALSFIGLGLALIGIGLIYQRLVFARPGRPVVPERA